MHDVKTFIATENIPKISLRLIIQIGDLQKSNIKWFYKRFNYKSGKIRWNEEFDSTKMDQLFLLDQIEEKSNIKTKFKCTGYENIHIIEK